MNNLDAVSTGSRKQTWKHPCVEETSHTKKLNVRRRVLFWLALLIASGINEFVLHWRLVGRRRNINLGNLDAASPAEIASRELKRAVKAPQHPASSSR